MANILQKKFDSVFSNPSDTNIEAASFEFPSIETPFTDDMLSFTIEDIITAIDEVKPNAAAGPDEIPISLLSKYKYLLAKLIHLIWTHSK